MELFFRKYFWVVNLTFLLLAAWLSAKTVNTFVASRLQTPPEIGQAPANPALAAHGPQKATLVPEQISRLTGIALPEPTPEVETDTPITPPLESQDPVKTGLRVKLVGTLVANRPEWSMANIEDVNSHETKVYMVGDKLQTAEVLEIERLRVIINNNGRKEFIDAEPGSGETPLATVSTAAPAVAAAPTPGPGAGIKAVDENTYEIPREDVTKALTNMNELAMQARIIPAFKDGVATGFKLFSIRPDSLYAKIGVQNGDVIRRINGFEINSPDKALEVYTKLRESSRVEIELERNGSAVKKTYNIR